MIFWIVACDKDTSDVWMRNVISHSWQLTRFIDPSQPNSLFIAVLNAFPFDLSVAPKASSTRPVFFDSPLEATTDLANSSRTVVMLCKRSCFWQKYIYEEVDLPPTTVTTLTSLVAMLSQSSHCLNFKMPPKRQNFSDCHESWVQFSG
jgi:hypothetical protein